MSWSGYDKRDGFKNLDSRAKAMVLVMPDEGKTSYVDAQGDCLEFWGQVLTFVGAE
jgi:hypothetical protein